MTGINNDISDDEIIELLRLANENTRLWPSDSIAIKKLIANHKHSKELLTDLKQSVEVMEIEAPESNEWLRGFEDCQGRVLTIIDWKLPASPIKESDNE